MTTQQDNKTGTAASEGMTGGGAPFFLRSWSPFHLLGMGMAGILLAITAHIFYSLHDATMKWLTSGYAVVQVFFTRCFVVSAICLLIGRAPLIERVRRSTQKGPMLVRTLILMTAWLLYITAAKYLPLAELVTLYFSCPLLVTILSVLMLKEQVHWQLWLATSVGFVGVIIACYPGTDEFKPAVLLVLVAAMLWGFSVVLLRRISHVESSSVQVLFFNATMSLLMFPLLFWFWKMPTPTDAVLLVTMGALIAAAQFLFMESFRFAPASRLAPFEYVNLICAFLWSYLIWGNVPKPEVFLGAGLIVMSGLWVIFDHWRQDRKRSPAG
ncbi:MAG: DMT family transporter [Pseudorhodoplanes sp.]